MVSSPRIAPLVQPLSGGLAEDMARLVPQGMPAPQLFLTVARNEGLFRHLVQTQLIGPTGLLDRRVLRRPVRECVILRTCVATRNDYEFNLHVQTISERMGLGWDQIEDVRRAAPQPALWSARQLAAMQLVDELVALEVSDATFDQARRLFDEADLIEITQLVGLYVGVAMQVALAKPVFDRYRFDQPVLAREA